MTQHFAVKLDGPLRAIELHTVPAQIETASPRVRWLLDFKQRAETERAEREALQQRLAGLLSNVEQAMAQVPDIVRQSLEQVANIATELGLSIAREVVGEVVDHDLADTATTVVRCLEEVVPGVQVRVHLTPDDLAMVTASFAEFPELSSRLDHATFVTDHSLDNGCVRIESDVGRTVYNPREVVERICQEVLKGVGGDVSPA